MQWQHICTREDLVAGSGVAALINGEQVALFYLPDQSPPLYAIGNHDPIGGANVLSRGIVGDRGGRATVQSPLKKQAFALDDGSCLDDPDMCLPVYATRITPDGDVQVGS